MLELFSFLFSLGTAINTVFNGLKSSEQKKLAKLIHQFHVQLQIIIDDSERIFNLIKTADEQIKEYGNTKFNRIVQDNFRYQFDRIIDLAEKIQNPDMSLIFEKLEDKLRKKLRSILVFKGDSIRNAILRLTYSKLKIENEELYIIHREEKAIAFPEIDKQIEILLELKKCSTSLGTTIYSLVDLKDLL